MLQLNKINHTYNLNQKNQTKVLNQINLEISLNQFIVLFGQSGSGKTTLLNIMAGLLKPTTGEVKYNGEDIYQLNDQAISNFRRDNIGFIFQNFLLDENFSALDNVKIPLFLHKKITTKEQTERAKNGLKVVGLAGKEQNKPPQLSGGEQQRVSIARALVNNPKFIIADEPTGNLDSKTGASIIQLLRQQVNQNCSVILVTHNENYITNGDVVYHINDGKITKVSKDE